MRRCAGPRLEGYAILAGVGLVAALALRRPELVVTDTIPLAETARRISKIRVLPVAPLLAEAIRRIHEEASISSLFV